MDDAKGGRKDVGGAMGEVEGKRGKGRRREREREREVPMRSDGKAIWVGGLVDDSDDDGSDSDSQFDSDEDEDEGYPESPSEQEQWTWAWKVDRVLPDLLEGTQHDADGEVQEEEEDGEEGGEGEGGEEVIGSVWNADGVTLLDLNRLLVDMYVFLSLSFYPS